MSDFVALKGSFDAFSCFIFSLVCYVCACVRSAKLQTSKSPTKGFFSIYK